MKNSKMTKLPEPVRHVRKACKYKKFDFDEGAYNNEGRLDKINGGKKRDEVQQY